MATLAFISSAKLLVETYGGNLSTINVSDFVFRVKFWDLWLELGKQIAMYIIARQQKDLGFGRNKQ